MSTLRCYVYYRVRAGSVEAALSQVRELHARWCAELPALRCERLRRDDMDGETVTLMEVLDGLDAQQQRRYEAQARESLAAWLVGERHVERFEPCA